MEDKSSEGHLINEVKSALKLEGNCILKGRSFHFRCCLGQQSPPDGEIINTVIMEKIASVRPVILKNKNGKIVHQYVRISFSTEDVEFRRKYHLRAYSNGTAELVHNGIGDNIPLSNFIKGDLTILPESREPI